MLFELSTLDSGPSDSRKPEGLTLGSRKSS
jgi:hypothetical protein